jgi:hypothetical protein
MAKHEVHFRWNDPEREFFKIVIVYFISSTSRKTIQAKTMRRLLRRRRKKEIQYPVSLIHQNTEPASGKVKSTHFSFDTIIYRYCGKFWTTNGLNCDKYILFQRIGSKCFWDSEMWIGLQSRTWFKYEYRGTGLSLNCIEWYKDLVFYFKGKKPLFWTWKLNHVLFFRKKKSWSYKHRNCISSSMISVTSWSTLCLLQKHLF